MTVVNGKLGLLLLLVTIMGLLIFFNVSVQPQSSQTASIILDGTFYLNLSSPSGGLTLVSKQEGLSFLGVTETIYEYLIEGNNQLIGNLAIVDRVFPDQSRMIFSRVDSQSDDSVIINQELSTLATRFFTYHFDRKILPEVNKDSHLGYDYTTNNFGLVDLYQQEDFFLSVLIGKEYVSRELTKGYENGHLSTVKELIHESNNLQLSYGSQERVSITMNQAVKDNRTSERFFYLSPQRALTNRLTVDTLYNVTTDELRWVDPDGSTKKIPWSIEPYTQKGYGRSLLLMRARSIKYNYRETHAPILFNFLLNNLYSLNRIRDEDGLWRTNYTSTWVTENTGIVAGFVDTRHNEMLSLHVIDASALLEQSGTPADELSGWELPFADYLVSKAQGGQYIATENGYFLHDYYNEFAETHSHVSLNHALGEMNYLYRIYERTGKEKYLEVAENIKQAVLDTGTRWIAADGDLHYMIDLDGEYSGRDYLFVTLKDLIMSQTILTRINGEANETFEELIISKLSYLGTAGRNITLYTEREY